MELIPIIYKLLLVVLFLSLLSIGISYLKNRRTKTEEPKETKTYTVKKILPHPPPNPAPKSDPIKKEEKFYKPLVTNSGIKDKNMENPRIEIIKDLKSKGKK
ncbi:hypothetical protein [Melioribacter sp. OK-6-Me]|uniref:hypothetical protein n=1 Tax=unclassified Melioribacter TaxID=2627329 RepID=UPI003ED8BC29